MLSSPMILYTTQFHTRALHHPLQHTLHPTLLWGGIEDKNSFHSL